MERRSLLFIGLLCLGHVVVDLHNGAVPALLPGLKERWDLSYTAVGGILLALSLTSSFLQPLLGVVSDLSSHRWLVPLGIFLSPLALALLGIAPSYGWALAAVVLMGIGVAAYHPEAARTAVHLAGSRRALGVAYWTVGGNLGYATGPLYAAAITGLLGVGGTAAVALPMGVLVALWVLSQGRAMAAQEVAVPGGAQRVRREDLPPTDWRGEGMLVAAVTLKSCLQLGILTYLPFYYTEVMGGPAAVRGLLLSSLLYGNVAGTLVGSPLADRFGMRRVMFWGFLIVVPLQALVLFGKGWPLYAILGLSGFCQAAASTLATALGQEYMPRYPALASGLNIGGAAGLGAALVTVLGAVADHFGVAAAMQVLVLLPVLTSLLLYLLPPPPRAVHT